MTTTLADGRFVLHTLLGEGGMALVYRAWDKRLRRWCAIKLLRPELARRPSLRQRFEREAQAMAVLDHKHIVRVFDVGGDDHATWIVMELCRSSLDDWLATHGKMPPRLAVSCMLQVAWALEAAHAQGIVHRDIKPQNVLVSEHGLCKVGDFGIAQVEATRLTRTGAAMGTLGFMAPEQRDDAKAVDERSDVYSLGATLYTLVTDRVSMDLHAADRDPSLLGAVPQALRPIVLQATAYHPRDRFRNVRVLRHALRDASALLPPIPPESPPLVAPADSGSGATAAPVTLDDGMTPSPAPPHPATRPTPQPRPEVAPRPPLPEDAFTRGEAPPAAAPRARPAMTAKELPLVPWAERGRREEPAGFDHLYEAYPDRPDPLGITDTHYVSEAVPFDPATAGPVEDPDAPPVSPDTVGAAGFAWAARQLLEFAGQIGVGLLGSMKYVVWPVALFGATVAYVGNQTTTTLRAHESEVTVRAGALEVALERDPTLASELIALGAPAALQAEYEGYLTTGDPEERRRIALRLAKLVEDQGVHIRDSADPEEMKHRKALRKRVEAVARARRSYGDAVRLFDEAADSLGGSLAVRLGLAPRPPEP